MRQGGALRSRESSSTKKNSSSLLHGKRLHSFFMSPLAAPSSSCLPLCKTQTRVGACLEALLRLISDRSG